MIKLNKESLIKEFLEAGVHFGHQVQRWNPKMKPFIFDVRKGVHIFDLNITFDCLEKTLEEVEKIIEQSGKILFVSTKKQAQKIIKNKATECGMPFLVERWLGGTLTNFKTIRSRLNYLKELEDKKEKEDISKKERIFLEKKLQKLTKIFEGIKDLHSLPQALFIVDPIKEKTALREAFKLKIPIIALADSNADPDIIDFIIPGNDDAVRSIELIVTLVAQTVEEGQKKALKKSQVLSEKETTIEKEVPEKEKAKRVKEKEETRKTKTKKVKEKVKKETPKEKPQKKTKMGKKGEK